MTMFGSPWFGVDTTTNPISLDATASVGDLGGSNVERINDDAALPQFETANRPLSGNKVIAKLDFGAAQLIAGFVAVNVKQDAGTSDGVSMKIEYSSDDSSYSTFGSAFNISPGNVNATETQTPTAQTKRYWQITANQNFDGPALIGELALYASTGQMP